MTAGGPADTWPGVPTVYSPVLPTVVTVMLTCSVVDVGGGERGGLTVSQ